MEHKELRYPFEKENVAKFASLNQSATKSQLGLTSNADSKKKQSCNVRRYDRTTILPLDMSMHLTPAR